MLKLVDELPTINLRTDDPDFPGLPKINVASIIGGRGRDVDLAGPSNLSDYCTIIIDVRYGGNWSPEQIDKQFIAFLETLRVRIPDFRYEYHHPPPTLLIIWGVDIPLRVGGLICLRWIFRHLRKSFKSSAARISSSQAVTSNDAGWFFPIRIAGMICTPTASWNTVLSLWPARIS